MLTTHRSRKGRASCLKAGLTRDHAQTVSQIGGRGITRAAPNDGLLTEILGWELRQFGRRHRSDLLLSRSMVQGGDGVWMG